MPVFGAGREGVGGAPAFTGGERTTGWEGAELAGFRSCKVRRVVRMVISKPLRSAMSNLLRIEDHVFEQG